MKRKAKTSFYDKFKIELIVTRGAKDELVPLLNEIKKLGDLGAGREIQILDWKDKNCKDSFYFDGDGPSKINEIKIDEYCKDSFSKIAKKIEEKFQPDLFEQIFEESKPQKTVIELFDSYGEEGKYNLWFKIDDKEYLYRTWSKRVFEDIKQKAKRQPGTALNMAKRDCKEIKLKPK